MIKKQLLPVLLLLLLCALTLGGCMEEDSGAYDRGMQALEKKEYSEAMDAFREADENDGRTAEALRGEGIVCMELGSYSQAEELFRESLDAMERENADFSGDVKLYLAECCILQEEYSEAEEILSGLLSAEKHDSVWASAGIMRGRICMLRGEEAEALAAFQDAADAELTFDTALQIYELLAAAGREGDGAVFIEKASHIEPETMEDYYELGQILAYLGEYDGAKTNLALAANAGFTDALLSQGGICLRQNDTAGARSLYQSYLEQGGNPAAAYNGLAMCDIAEENYESAAININRGLSYNDEEENRNLLFNEIVICERRQDFKTAKEKMAEFLKKYPSDPEGRRENMFLSSR